MCLVERLVKAKYKKSAQFYHNSGYYKYFVQDKDYFLSGLVAAPLTVDIYTK